MMKRVLVVAFVVAVLGLGAASLVSAQMISGFPTTNAQEAATAQGCTSGK